MCTSQKVNSSLFSSIVKICLQEVFGEYTYKVCNIDVLKLETECQPAGATGGAMEAGKD